MVGGGGLLVVFAGHVADPSLAGQFGGSPLPGVSGLYAATLGDDLSLLLGLYGLVFRIFGVDGAGGTAGT